MQIENLNDNRKTKLVLLIDILKRYSDENHPLSAPDIIRLFEKRGVRCERKYIYNAIESLMDYGMDINRTHRPKQGFYLGEREFELAEIKILTDAVLSASFISEKKTDELLQKLASQLSTYQAETVLRGMNFSKSSKSNNEEIYYNIDTITQALCQNRQISFIYQHTVIADNTIAKDNGKLFTVSPYALIWSNDRYYLVCNYSKYNNISHYRIDRMKKVKLLPETSRSCAEVSIYKSNDNFDVVDYVRKSLGMFTGVEECVELICDKDLLEIIIDRFGTNIVIKNYSTKQLRVIMPLFISKMLVSWLVEHSDKIYVSKPVSLRNEVKDKIEKIYLNYFKSNEYLY